MLKQALSRDRASTKPKIADRLLITDAIIAIIAIAGVIFVTIYGIEHQRLVKEQVMLSMTEELIKDHRETAFQTHVAATALRERWNQASTAEQRDMVAELQSIALEFGRTGNDLIEHDPVAQLPEFESGPDAIGQLLTLSDELAFANQPGDAYSARANLGNEFNGNYRFLLGMLEEIESIASMNSARNQREIASDAKQLVMVIVSGGIVLIIGLALRFGLMLRWVVRPAHKLARVTTEFADGEVARTVPPMPVDELQRIADALTVFRDVTTEAKELRERTHEADLKAQESALDSERKARETREKMESERQAAILEMASRFEASVSNAVITASNATQELDAASQQLASSVSAAGSQASEIATASGQAAQSVQSVAAAVEELSSYVHDISDQVARQSQLSQDARQSSEASVSNAQVLAEKTASIDEIANVIGKIAEQTNLLALNASIEAARAGNSGMGFNVVASEVKNLASKSQQSALEIGGVLQTVNGDVSDAVSSIETVAESLSAIGQISGKVTDAMDRHESIASEVAQHAAMAAQGTMNVNNKIADLAVNTEQASVLSQDVKLAVRELSHQSRALEQAAQDFLQLMRT